MIFTVISSHMFECVLIQQIFKDSENQGRLPLGWLEVALRQERKLIHKPADYLHSLWKRRKQAVEIVFVDSKAEFAIAPKLVWYRLCSFKGRLRRAYKLTIVHLNGFTQKLYGNLVEKVSFLCTFLNYLAKIIWSILQTVFCTRGNC